MALKNGIFCIIQVFCREIAQGTQRFKKLSMLNHGSDRNEFFAMNAQNRKIGYVRQMRHVGKLSCSDTRILPCPRR